MIMGIKTIYVKIFSLALIVLSCGEETRECTTFEMLNLSSGVDCFYCENLEVPIDNKYYRICEDESGERVLYVSAENAEEFNLKYVDSTRNQLHIRIEEEDRMVEQIGTFGKFYYEVLIDKKIDSVKAYITPGYFFNSDTITLGDSLKINFIMLVKGVIKKPAVIVNICDYDLKKFYVRNDTVSLDDYFGEYVFIPDKPGVYTFVGWLIYEESLTAFEFETEETINRSFEVLPKLPLLPENGKLN